MSYVKSFFKVIPYYCVNRNTKERIEKHRLNSLLKYAKNNSEYYKKIIPDNLSFESIKPTNKLQMMDNYDDIVTNKKIKLKNVIDSSLSNIDDISFVQTSGSTGNPIVVAQDKNYRDDISVKSFLIDLKGIFPIFMVSLLGFSGGIGSNIVNSNTSKNKYMNKVAINVALNDGFDTYYKKMKDAGAGVITGYSSNVYKLATELLQRKMTLKEKLVYVSGEAICENQKKMISKAFDCEVRELYGCTEAAIIAKECKCGHLHIDSNLYKIEPIDENLNVVGYGVKSDALLLTNYLNYTQPFIRYIVSDCIVLHKGSECKCGNKSDYIELEGRKEDHISFIDKSGKEIMIQYSDFYFVTSNISNEGLDYFRNFQLVINHNKRNIIFRLDYYDDCDRKKIEELLKKDYDKYFTNINVEPFSYSFEGNANIESSITGKFKIIIEIK